MPRPRGAAPSRRRRCASQAVAAYNVASSVATARRRGPRFWRPASAIEKPQVPFAFEAAQESVAATQGVEHFLVTRMHEHTRAFSAKPTVMSRQLVDVARIDASAHGGGALPPGVGQQAPQHDFERAVARGNL